MAPMLRLLLAGAAATALAAPDADAVASLPGYGPPPSRQWSGFLNASAAEPGTMLHYWLAEAESPDAASMPVVLWLNGGPGSSSILGWLQEHGPLLINATGGLMRNPYAWTKQANVFVLESPAGVGFSYCAAMLKGGACSNTDKSTAAAARAAVRDFFATKFPELRANPFYITGESYAGVYIPTLTQELLDHAPEVNIKGVAVGDPCTDNSAQKDSMDMLWYAHKYGFLPQADFDLLWHKCGHRSPSLLARGAWKQQGGRLVGASEPEGPMAADCKAAHRRFLAVSSRAFSQDWPHAWINDLSLFGPAATVTSDQKGSLNYLTAAWMTRPDVREALHVLVAGPSQAWPGPSEGWSYTSSYAACNAAAPGGAESMVDFYRRIVPRLATTVVFNGDTDPCVSYEGTRTAVEEVGFARLDGGQYRPWFYNHSKAAEGVLREKPLLFGPDLSLQDAGAQLGGMVVNYAHNLSFVTVHGSGHMVPQFRPQAAEVLLRKLLTGEAFAPPMISDAELAAMSDDAFDAALDAWTIGAQGGVVAEDRRQAPVLIV